VFEDLRQTIEDFSGPAAVVVEIEGPERRRFVRLGEAYRVQNTPTVRAELEHALSAERPMPAVALAPAASASG
jgi:hypothetical protein